MAKIQYMGIKYPFESKDVEEYFVDLNKNMRDDVRSKIMHVIFTPKGQKIRDPEFGTNLMKYIFQPNDKQSWNEITREISDSVKLYVPNVIINSISILDDTEHFSELLVRIDYSVSEGNLITKDTVITKV